MQLTFLFLNEAYSLGMLTAARWSIYQEFAYDITPLIKGCLFGIFNPDDGSYAVVPSVTYSVITNLDLLLIAQVFEGDPLTEFGGIFQLIQLLERNQEGLLADVLRNFHIANSRPDNAVDDSTVFLDQAGIGTLIVRFG